MNETVELARQRLAEITGKRGALEQRRLDVQAQREQLSYDAQYDATVRKRLDRLVEEALRLGAEAEDLASAARESERRLTAALDREARAEAVDRAEEAQRLLPALRLAGEAATKALIEFLERFDDIHRIADAIRASGAQGWPSAALYHVNVKRSLQATLHTRGLSTEALPPPASRVDLNRLLQSWADNLEVSLGRTLEEEEAA